MNKITTLAVALLFSGLLAVGSAFAEKDSEYTWWPFEGAEPAVAYDVEGQSALEPTPEYTWWPFAGAEPVAASTVMSRLTGWNTFEASSLIGYQVWSPITGSNVLGQISDLVIDQSNGRIALVVLSDVPGFGAEKVAAPYASVVWGRGGYFYLNVPSEDIGFSSGDYDYRYRLAMTPGVLPERIDSSWVAYVYRLYGLVPYWTETGEHPLMDLYTSSKVIGADFQLPYGRTMGKIDDLVIDSSDGHIAFLTLSDVEGRGGLVAVPFNILSRGGENTFALNITEDKLAAAPGFYEHTDMGNRAYAAGVYRFFGVQPYWTEGEMY
jgi:sporulation protein YlmC with PRC-barrel domain